MNATHFRELVREQATVERPVQRIEVRALTLRFGAVAALRSVSCDFEAGTLTFVQGSNGAGKSSLLAVLSTTLGPTQGSVNYVPLGRDRAAARREIGWVAHESHCYRELTGRENVTLAARMYGVRDAAAVEHVCQRVNGSDFFDQPVGTLSRGQRQRVALARALVHSPSILLLDEPLTGLDKDSARHFEKIVQEERERHSVVVIVTHDDDWMQRLGGNCVVLHRGRVAS